MFCLKCGRETEGEHVFCNACLSVMARYPVKPGTAVHLPKPRSETTGKKQAARKRAISQEEQIQRLKKNLRRSRLIGLVLFLAFSLAAVLLVREFASGDAPIIGQNYTINLNLDSE